MFKALNGYSLSEVTTICGLQIRNYKLLLLLYLILAPSSLLLQNLLGGHLMWVGHVEPKGQCGYETFSLSHEIWDSQHEDDWRLRIKALLYLEMATKMVFVCVLYPGGLWIWITNCQTLCQILQRWPQPQLLWWSWYWCYDISQGLLLQLMSH